MNISDLFVWGAATAAYQIEGAVKDDGRGPSIWDSYSYTADAIANGDNGDIADDSYHKIHEDVQIMKDMGLQAYRFSISWSRILPLGYGDVNQAGIDHYNTLINELTKAGIVPFVTLYHWDLPQGLQDKYLGLLSDKFEIDFANFADICFHNFGDRVKKWVTINEPWTIAYMGYGIGVHAPGRCSNRLKCVAGNSATEPYLVGHNLLNAHAAAVQRYRSAYQPSQHGEIGIVLNLDWGQGLTRAYVDNIAAVRHNEFQLGWFADPIFYGRYPDTMLLATTTTTTATTTATSTTTTTSNAASESFTKSTTGAAPSTASASTASQDATSRMPKFTAAQRDRLVGSVDFLGLNHYSTRYYVDAGYSPHAYIGPDSLFTPANRHKVKEGGDLGTGWAWDQQSFSTKYDLRGRLIGQQAESEWLNAVPWGFFDVLVYVHNRYSIAYSAGRRKSSSSESSATESYSESLFLPSNTSNGALNTREKGSSASEALSSSADSGDHSSSSESSNESSSSRIRSASRSLPIYVTENGCDAPDEAKMPLEQALHDDFRIAYLAGYLAELQRARRSAGVDVRGYFVWSLLDNFEWADGYDKRFGLVHVDYASPNHTRHPKDSARWYAQYIRDTGAAIPPAAPGTTGEGDLLLLGAGRGRREGEGEREGVLEGREGVLEGREGVFEEVGREGRADLLGSGAWSALAVLLLVLALTVYTRCTRKRQSVRG